MFNAKYSASANNLNWILPDVDQRLADLISQKLGIDNIASSLLLNRGLSTIHEIELFLNGKLREVMPDPFLLQDMHQASERIIQAIIKHQKIVAFTDYDVDGATSAALLYNFFKALGVTIGVYVPDRILEGYGPNVEAMRIIKKNGADLVLMLDCGTTAYEPLKVASEIGLDVIVIDHHIASDSLPIACAVINPNRPDDLFPEKSIAAVAVAFFVIVAVRKKLRDINWFSQGRNEPDLMNCLDLVALGTVCDIMPLTGINRIFVKYGLKLIAQRNNLGIATLFDIAKINSKPQAYHLGYVLGPRINAGGRIGESSLGVALLTADNQHTTYEIAVRLEELNIARKELEAEALASAIEHVEKTQSQLKPIIIAIGKDWHVGVIGILASRLKERYSKPALVVSVRDGIGKGSARSVSGIDIGNAITSARQAGLLLDGGGHAMAGGFTIQEEKLEAFANYIENCILDTHESHFFLQKASEICIDAVISAQAANLSLLKALEMMEPFGNANRSPRFAIYKVRLLKISIFALKNLSILVTDSILPNVNCTSEGLKCVFFRGLETQVGAALLESAGKYVDIIGNLQETKMDKRKIQFIIEDIILYE